MTALFDNHLGEKSIVNGYEDLLRGIFGAAALLAVISGAELLFFGTGFFTSLELHPFWIVILIAALQHGPGVGIASVAMATFFMGWPDRLIGEDAAVYAARIAVQPLQWLVVALIVGLYSQKRLLETKDLRMEVSRLQALSDKLAAEVERMDSLVLDLERDSVTRSVAERQTKSSELIESGIIRGALPELAALAGAHGSELPAAFEAASLVLFDGPVALIASVPGEDALFIGCVPDMECSLEALSEMLFASLGNRTSGTVDLKVAGLAVNGAARIVQKCAHVENGLTATAIFFAKDPAEADAGTERLDLIAEMARIAIDRVSLELDLDKRAQKLSQTRD